MYFLNEDSEFCYNEKYWQQYIADNTLSELTVFKAQIKRNSGFFYCNVHRACGEVGNCGIECNEYSPRNGKNGICRHYRNTYYPGEKVVLKNKKLNNENR